MQSEQWGSMEKIQDYRQEFLSSQWLLTELQPFHIVHLIDTNVWCNVAHKTTYPCQAIHIRCDQIWHNKAPVYYFFPRHPAVKLAAKLHFRFRSCAPSYCTDTNGQNWCAITQKLIFKADAKEKCSKNGCQVFDVWELRTKSHNDNKN